MGEGILARQIGMTEMSRKNWDDYNRNFKVWCEGERFGRGSEEK